MGVLLERPKPLVRKTPTLVDTTYNIQRWDWDNLYPQRMEEIAGGSYTLNSVLGVIADFLAGEGFEDEALATTILNNDGFTGETANDILDKVSGQEAWYKTQCLHFGYNLNYQISSIRVTDISYVRLGYPNPDGSINKLRYCTNWELQAMKEAGEQKILDYNLFNPDPEQVKLEIELAGGIDNYKGQILFLTPGLFQYPKAAFDPVKNHAEAQYELGVMKPASIQNRFAATMLFVHPGEFETDDEKNAWNQLIANKSGSRATNSNIGIQDKTGKYKASDLATPITPVNTDKLYELTEKMSIAAILENEAMPKALAGIEPETGMFNQQSMIDAYNYYNARTRKRRRKLSRLFSYIMKFWQQPLETDAAILELQYEVSDSSAGNAPVEGMKDLSGRGNQGLNRIIREFKKGVTDMATAKNKLMDQFGMTEEQAAKYLDNDPNNDPALPQNKPA